LRSREAPNFFMLKYVPIHANEKNSYLENPKYGSKYSKNVNLSVPKKFEIFHTHKCHLDTYSCKFSTKTMEFKKTK
jgi:hypothetical protein